MKPSNRRTHGANSPGIIAIYCRKMYALCLFSVTSVMEALKGLFFCDGKVVRTFCKFTKKAYF